MAREDRSKPGGMGGKRTAGAAKETAEKKTAKKSTTKKATTKKR